MTQVVQLPAHVHKQKIKPLIPVACLQMEAAPAPHSRERDAGGTAACMIKA
jgi:hypothetical protein